MRSALCLLLPIAAFTVAEVQAAETGGIRGRVLDEEGLEVPGAEIVVTGVNIGGERTATTSGDGTFRYFNIPPGSHELLVRKSGFAPMKYTVTVVLDQTVFVPVTLKATAGAGEEIVVEEKLPVIDATRSTVSTAMSEELIQNVPVGRSFQDVTNMAPGVYGRIDTQNGGPSDGNPSVRGEGQYGNNYLVDGISTRDPATKTFGTDINFDAIEEIQVYTDGLPAEFGEATGMLVNVVTKDGGDEHHGSAGYYLGTTASSGQYYILDIEQGAEVLKDKRSYMAHELSGTAGGPLVKEKLWYFAAFDGTMDDIAFEGLPADYPYVSRGADGFGKITWFASQKVTVQYQVSLSGTSTENYETSGLYATPEAQALYNSSDLTNIATLRWRPYAAGELEVKASTTTSRIDVVPSSGDEDTPMVYDWDTGLYTTNYDSFDRNRRGRLGASFKYTHILENALGDHKFKVGGEYWQLTDEREMIYTGPGDGIRYERYESLGFPCTAAANYEDCYGYTEYTSAGPLGHQGNIMGAFLQDDWEIVDPLTLNLGVRVDRETLFQNEGLKILDQYMPAPRLGAAWDITNDSKTVFTVNAGRYYDLSGNSFADWGDTRSAFVYSEYRDFDEDPTTQDMTLIWEQDPVSNPLIYCTEASVSAIADPDSQTAAREMCDAYGWLKPYHMDKLVVGLEREVIPLLAVGIKGVMSTTRDLPEDVNTDDYTWVITNPASKRRDYRGVELTVEKKSDGVWQALASYTLSESKGTTPGQFEMASGGQWGSNGNEVGVYMDDINDPDVAADYVNWGYGWYVDGLEGLGTKDDDSGWYGYLPYHSFHLVKLSGSYTLPFGMTLGAIYEFDSGHAWQKRGLVDLYGDYYGFPEGRGTRFMPPLHYFDLRVAYAYEFSDKRSVEASLDMFNVLDLEGPVTYYENDNEMFGLTMYRQEPRAVRGGLKFTY